MINKTLVADLDDDILEMALNIFFKNASVEMNQLNSAFDNNSLKEVATLAHKLRGSSISVGLEEFSNQAKCIEEGIKSKGDISRDLVKELNILFDKSRDYINSL